MKRWCGLAETSSGIATLIDQDTRGTEMDPALYNLIEPAVVFATLLGTAFGVKLLIWGKGPIKRARAAEENPALAQRVAELEDQLEQSNEVIRHQAELMDDVLERVDFAERMLTRHKEEQPKGLGGPNAG
jgi:hypothetical protein